MTLKLFLDQWREKPRTRKNYKSVLSKIYQVAIDEGFIQENIVKKIALPKSHKINKNFKAWTLEHIDQFVATADDMGLPNVGTAVIIAWESFRQTDVFDLQEPRDYRNGGFIFETSKTGELVSILASPKTKRRLSLRPKTQLLLTVNDLTGMKWTKNSFRNKFDQVRDKANMHGYVFRKIRNSAAIYALKAGLTDAEFQQRFGWSKATVEEMKLRYSDIDQEIIDSGAEKLRAYQEQNP
ncbi:hypothetical protein [Roseivirga pacifica]|uniref:hypothetical protein n=1 Tax=Roseivirga pacifica TaxID=1267423 RepID=UPI00227A9613|nr:hypothetical protein [Roseivirga pacifica]